MPTKAKNVKKAKATAAPPTVVYIHGLGNKSAPTILKREWDKALFDVDMGARTRMAYWADILYPAPLGPSSLSIRGDGEMDTPSRAELFASVGRLVPEESEKAKDYILKLLARADRPPAPVKAKEIEAKILFFLPQWLRKALTERVLKALLKDSAAYFFNPELKSRIQDRLKALLVPQDEPYIIVSHSQGTIISYDVLHALADQGVRVSHWFTLGSPLGIQEVQDNLTQPLRVPANVGRWLNFADRLDPVALDNALAGDFEPAAKITDKTVVNRDSLRLSGFNPHSATGYLATSEVQTTVRGIVGPAFADPVAPFVIARDVAFEMSKGEPRIPVLIGLQDTEGTGSLDDRRQGLVRELETLTGHEKEAEIDPLKRFVAARLSAGEIERLTRKHKDLQISTIWKNSEKKGLIEQASQVVQALPAQRAYGITGKGIHWAVLDTGIRANHPHFKSHTNVEKEWDCTAIGAVKAGAVDGNGHGTHVAGIIAGTGKAPHADRIAMAPEAKLHVYKVLKDDGRGNDSWIIKALDHIYAVNEGSPQLKIHGVNLSLGGSFDPMVYGCGHSPLCDELRRLWRQGVVVCIAAGNEGRLVLETSDGQAELTMDLSIGDPANLEEAIAVGSVHTRNPHNYGVSYFSSRGPTADGRSKPDLVAPGERVVSCNTAFDADPASHYIAMSGTSMACPVVSGVIAGFLSLRREFIGFPDRVKQILLDNCTDLKRDRYHQGAGLPNLVRMLVAT